MMGRRALLSIPALLMGGDIAEKVAPEAPSVVTGGRKKKGFLHKLMDRRIDDLHERLGRRKEALGYYKNDQPPIYIRNKKSWGDGFRAYVTEHDLVMRARKRPPDIWDCETDEEIIELLTEKGFSYLLKDVDKDNG